MLPLALASQLSTSGIGKAVPSVLCKLIWSFVKERNTAKLIKASLFAHGIRLCFTAHSDITGSRWAFLHIYFFNTKRGQEEDYRFTVNKYTVRKMSEMIEDGERHAPPPYRRHRRHPLQPRLHRVAPTCISLSNLFCQY